MDTFLVDYRISPRGNSAECSNIFEAEIKKLALTYTPDPNLPTGVASGVFALENNLRRNVSRASISSYLLNGEA